MFSQTSQDAPPEDCEVEKRANKNVNNPRMDKDKNNRSQLERRYLSGALLAIVGTSFAVTLRSKKLL